ncbi:hypothetical protein Acr_00g0058500 [Actinidia rufa]|uniref:F-box associated beta-propeller type 1 domain-containing protein n=1 Tax=Actinidia rufa TaxID=165716 RepID=A0A7J0DMW8_9ERIC|nr:hypothetical protein Acr_00g0058500 [Actinidia rufa]
MLLRPQVTFMTHGGFDHAIGFGFDAKSNDYKVVRIVYLIDDRDAVVPPEIDVYSTRTGAWRNISHMGLRYWVRHRTPQVFLNGATYWIESDAHWIVASVMERRTLMVLFELGDELFRPIMLPACIADDGVSFRRLRPDVFRGWLALGECGKRREEGVWPVGDTEAASNTELGIGGTTGYRCPFKLESYTESLGLQWSQVHSEQNIAEGAKKKKTGGDIMEQTGSKWLKDRSDGDGVFQDYGRTGGDIMEQTGSKWLKDRSDMVKYAILKRSSPVEWRMREMNAVFQDCAGVEDYNKEVSW